MNISHEREALKQRLLNSKEHRKAFVSACVDHTIPFQIRALRLGKERNWTQEELAHHAGMKQEAISRCENPNYGSFSLRTLKQLAAAFDVALIVRFSPFSELVEWETNISAESLEVPSFDEEEDYFKENTGNGIEILQENYSAEVVHQEYAEPLMSQPTNILYLNDYRQKIDKRGTFQESTGGVFNAAIVR